MGPDTRGTERVLITAMLARWPDWDRWLWVVRAWVLMLVLADVALGHPAPGLSGRRLILLAGVVLGAVRVVVADDQRVVREGLVTSLSVLPGVEVVGSAADGEQALALVRRHRPQVVLMDLRMPRVDGVEATRRILADCPATAVVVLTTYADDDSILAALRAGARGYLTKDAGREQIARALHAAAGGQAILDPAVQARLVAATGPAPDAATSRRLPDGLTAREAEVLSLIATGRSG
jgi:DNA-binding NarL/FixJ family response regulator